MNDNALTVTTPDLETPGGMLAVIERAAGNASVDVEKMERLLAMHERITARQAETAFNVAMSDAQNEMPRVQRDAKNPSTNSLYTRLESLNREAVPIYTKHGFALSFGTADCPILGYFRVTCLVSHSAGHSRPYQVDLPIDDTGAKGAPSKTKMHGSGSTFSYGRRYLTLLIFNISLTNEDDDGNHARAVKPAGPSTMAPQELSLSALTSKLWAMLAAVRGTERNWNAANQWLYKMEILDGGIPEAMPNLSAKRIEAVIRLAEAKLKA